MSDSRKQAESSRQTEVFKSTLTDYCLLPTAFFISLCNLRVLCVSVANNSLRFTRLNFPLRASGVSFALAFIFGLCLLPTPANAQQSTPQTAKAAERTQYKISLKLDFDARSYTGTERVRWINHDSRPTAVIYFHLYSNLRDNAAPTTRAEPFSIAGINTAPEPSAAPTPDEPHIEIAEVRTAQTAQPLAFSLDDQEMTLRVQMREPVAAGASVEVEIKFKGSVPEIDPDETSLPAHVVQQVGAGLRE